MKKIKRLKEPSTWAGFAALLQVASAFLPQYAPIFHALTVGAGSLAAALPEGGKE
ncbi:MAG: hypothetical protein ACEQSE_00950 [Candidatus Aquirickettsiella gammari]